MDPNERALIFLTEQMQDLIQEIVKREPAAIATALIFAMSEVTMRRAMEEPSGATLADVMEQSGQEALRLVDSVHMSVSTNTKEVLH